MSYLSTADSFSKGIITQLQPRMLFAVVLPLIIAFVSIIFLLIFAWNLLDEWFFGSVVSRGWFQQALSFGWNFLTMTDWLAGLLSFISLSAIGVVIGLAAASILVTPLAVKFVSERYFPQLEKKGQHVNSVSTFNAIKVSCIFIFGWLLTLPLWLIPFMSIILSLFWGAYAFSHMSQVDAIVEHATAEERRYILSAYKKGFWFIGFVCAALSLIPFMGLVMPVFSIIVCTHYGLKALEHHRQQAKTVST